MKDMTKEETMFELNPVYLWAIPESVDSLWEQINNLGPEATHGAMLMMNFIAHNYQSGKIAPIDPEYKGVNQ